MVRLAAFWLRLALLTFLVDGTTANDEHQSDRVLRLGSRSDAAAVGGDGRLLNAATGAWNEQSEGFFLTDFGRPYYDHIPWNTSPRQPTETYTQELFTVPIALGDGIPKTMQRGRPGEVMVYQLEAGPEAYVKCFVEQEGKSSCIADVTTTRNRRTVTVLVSPETVFSDMTIMCRSNDLVTTTPAPAPPTVPTPTTPAPFGTSLQPAAPVPITPTPRPTRARFPTASPTVDCGFNLFGFSGETNPLARVKTLFGWF